MHAKTNHTSTRVSDDIGNPTRISDDISNLAHVTGYDMCHQSDSATCRSPTSKLL